MSLGTLKKLECLVDWFIINNKRIKSRRSHFKWEIYKNRVLFHNVTRDFHEIGNYVKASFAARANDTVESYMDIFK